MRRMLFGLVVVLLCGCAALRPPPPREETAAEISARWPSGQDKPTPAVLPADANAPRAVPESTASDEQAVALFARSLLPPRSRFAPSALADSSVLLRLARLDSTVSALNRRIERQGHGQYWGIGFLCSGALMLSYEQYVAWNGDADKLVDRQREAWVGFGISAILAAVLVEIYK